MDHTSIQVQAPKLFSDIIITFIILFLHNWGRKPPLGSAFVPHYNLS